MSTRLEVRSPQSLSTDSTVPSTVWGPGTLSGRAILALGEAALKGLDRLIDFEGRAIQRRLGLIRQSRPNHLTPQMCDDLIELSRSDLYPESIPAAAADLIFRQIDHGCAAAVALSLTRLSLSDAHLVLHELFATRERKLLNNWYRASQLSKCGRDWGPDPALDFLAMLVQTRPEMISTCSAVLNHSARNPDIGLLFLRFPDHPTLRMHSEETLNIPSICRTPLARLQPIFFGDLTYRWINWKLLEKAGHSAESRLVNLKAILQNAVSNHRYWDPDFFDSAIDLVDFILYSRVPEIRRAAADLLSECLSLARDAWEHFRLVLELKGMQKVMSSLGHGSHNLPIRGPFQDNPLLCEFFRCTLSVLGNAEPVKIPSPLNHLNSGPFTQITSITFVLAVPNPLKQLPYREQIRDLIKRNRGIPLSATTMNIYYSYLESLSIAIIF
ncbi:hypothetical protein DFH06DRAFT_157113 [Mycena polygramma]|nr:hypothetical protein DFH06DRAFT_157113 [Mycena polygramma]